ncbi:MAG: hypothetical protein R2851_18025 [Caldilineaceae bacterium]
MSDTEQPNSDAWLPEEEDPRRAPSHPLGDATPDDDLPARLRNWRVIAETGEEGPDPGDVTTFADDAITVEVDGEFSAMTVAVAHDASDDPASDPALDPFADDPATSIPPLLDPVSNAWAALEVYYAADDGPAVIARPTCPWATSRCSWPVRLVRTRLRWSLWTMK